MDYDVELIKPLDPLLDKRFFLARELPESINGAVMGSVPQSFASQLLLSKFPAFTNGEWPANHYGPIFLTREIETAMAEGVLPPSEIEILTADYFYPYLWRDQPDRSRCTENTYAIHHWAGSWLKGS